MARASQATLQLLERRAALTDSWDLRFLQHSRTGAALRNNPLRRED